MTTVILQRWDDVLTPEQYDEFVATRIVPGLEIVLPLHELTVTANA